MRSGKNNFRKTKGKVVNTHEVPSTETLSIILTKISPSDTIFYSYKKNIFIRSFHFLSAIMVILLSRKIFRGNLSKVILLV